MSRDSSADKFCLKWNDFDSNLRSSFQKFREEKDFFDVSLVCEDEQVDAHRMVLSASSAFFKNLFKRNKHQHPLVYLKGVSSEELNCLLQFMYQGEVTVAQEEITTFLAAAEELKIHGLTQNLHKDTKEPSKPKKKSSTPPKLLPKQIKSDKVNPSNNSNSESDADVVIPMMPPVPITDMYDDSHDDIAEVPLDDPLGGHGASSMVPYYSDYDESHSSSIDLADDKYLFNNMMQDPTQPFNYDNFMSKVFDGSGLYVFECNVCKKIMRRKDHMKNHVQIHLSKEVKCEYCGTTCKNTPSLKVHISQKHRQLTKVPETDPSQQQHLLQQLIKPPQE